MIKKTSKESEAFGFTNKEILELELDPTRFEGTIKEYLYELLKNLWYKRDTFSGKYPFGNSGWEWDLYGPLVKAGIVKGVIHEEYEDGSYDFDVEDTHQAFKVIDGLIDEVFK